MTEPRWRDLAAAYALDALDPDERAAFEVQLREDPELHALVATYRESLAGIARELGRDPPPVHLRERILRHARERRPPAPRPTRAGRGPREQVAVSGSRMRWAFAASVALLVGTGIFGAVMRDRASELADEVVVLEAELAAIRDELGAAQGLLARYDSLAATFAGGSLRFASLTEPTTAPAAAPRLHLVLNRERGVLLVAAVDLPPAPGGRAYQLWGIPEGEDPVSLGLFDSQPDGSALLTLAFSDPREFDLGAVSEEPAQGSLQPTTDPFLVGNWTGGES